jgi:hypothetical protein
MILKKYRYLNLISIRYPLHKISNGNYVINRVFYKLIICIQIEEKQQYVNHKLLIIY